jgi:MinD-like ATPase involved in chromosome partitioning or flagellar assembly
VGAPIVAVEPESEISEAFREIARQLAGQVSMQKIKTSPDLKII